MNRLFIMGHKKCYNSCRKMSTRKNPFIIILQNNFFFDLIFCPFNKEVKKYDTRYNEEVSKRLLMVSVLTRQDEEIDGYTCVQHWFNSKLNELFYLVLILFLTLRNLNGEIFTGKRYSTQNVSSYNRNIRT